MADIYTDATTPVTYPVTLDEVKAWLKVTSTYEDDIINGLIVAATMALEDYTGRYFIARDVTGEFDAIITTCRTEIYPYVSFNRAKLNSVTSVEAFSNGSWGAISYQLKNSQTGYARMLLNGSYSFDDMPRPLRATCNCGYGDAADVPEPIKTVLKMFVSFLYLNRGDCGGVNCAEVFMNGDGVARMMISPYRIQEVFA